MRFFRRRGTEDAVGSRPPTSLLQPSAAEPPHRGDSPAQVGPAGWETLAPTRPLIARGPQLMLDSAPAEWLPDYRDPTFSLSPLTHFVSDQAPAGLVSLTGQPYRGTSVLPEGAAAMPEVELVPRRVERPDGDAATAESGPDNGRVYFAIPRREPRQPVQPAAASAVPRPARRTSTSLRAMPARRPSMSRAPGAITDPTPRPSVAQTPPGAVEARSGSWRDSQWQNEGGAVSIPSWTQSVASRYLADAGNRSGSGFQPVERAAGAAAPASAAAPQPPGMAHGAEASNVAAPNLPVTTGTSQPAAALPGSGSKPVERAAGAAAPAPAAVAQPPGAAPNLPVATGTSQPAAASPGAGSTSEGGSPPPGHAASRAAAAPLGRQEADAERGLLGDRDDRLTAGRQVATPPVEEVANPPAPETGVGAGPDGQSLNAFPRHSGSRQPAPASGNQDGVRQGQSAELPFYGATRDSRQPGTPVQAGSVVLSKSALGEMRVSGVAPRARGAYPTVVPESRAGRGVSVDPFGLPSRPLVGARPLAAEPEPGAVELPGVGPVEVRQDAMADARLRNADALGSTTGGHIDISPSLGSVSGPQAIGVFAHELTHVYQQRALGGRPMPDPASVEGKRMEAQAESVRRTVERSPAAFAATGPASPPGIRAPGSVAPASPSGKLPPRALAVARVAASAVASAPIGSGLAASVRPAITRAGAGPADQPGAVRPAAPRVISGGAPAAHPAPQRIVSPVAGMVAGAGAPAGGASTQHLASGHAAATKDAVNSASAPSQSEMRIPEQEVNRLYREFLHRFKNQLRWEADRNGRVNRFFKD